MFTYCYLYFFISRHPIDIPSYLAFHCTLLSGTRWRCLEFSDIEAGFSVNLSFLLEFLSSHIWFDHEHRTLSIAIVSITIFLQACDIDFHLFAGPFFCCAVAGHQCLRLH